MRSNQIKLFNGEFVNQDNFLRTQAFFIDLQTNHPDEFLELYASCLSGDLSKVQQHCEDNKLKVDARICEIFRAFILTGFVINEEGEVVPRRAVVKGINCPTFLGMVIVLYVVAGIAYFVFELS